MNASTASRSLNLLELKVKKEVYVITKMSATEKQWTAIFRGVMGYSSVADIFSIYI